MQRFCVCVGASAMKFKLGSKGRYGFAALGKTSDKCGGGDAIHRPGLGKTAHRSLNLQCGHLHVKRL